MQTRRTRGLKLRRGMMILLLLGFAHIASPLLGGNILLVTDNGWRNSRAATGTDPAPEGTFPEDDFAAFLTGLGHDVTVATGVDGTAQFRENNNGAPTPAQLGPGGLHPGGIDLIIISRVTDSGQYDAAPSTWNAITTPILSMAPHTARSSRWKWLDTTDATTAVRPVDLVFTDPNHPFVVGQSTDFLNAEGQLSTTSNHVTTMVGNGTLIATIGDQPAIVEWTQGTEFYAGAGETAGGPRVLFTSVPYHEDHNGAPATFDDYSDSGKAILAQTINVLAPATELLPGDVNGDGVVDLDDFAIIRDNFGESSKLREEGDLNFDRDVDFDDFRIWKDIFSAAGAPASVPEPSAVVLLVLGLVAAPLGRRFLRCSK